MDKMASKEDTSLSKKEKHLDALLKEGNRYIIIMQQLYSYYKINSVEYKKLLFVMDRYSRYKTQLREDIEEMKEMFAEMDDVIDEEENSDEDEEDEDEFLPIEVEDYEERNDEDIFMEEQVRYLHNIIHRKNILANMEMIFLRMLNVDEKLTNFQMSAHSKLKIVLNGYCKKVTGYLKRNVKFMKSLDDCKDKRLAKRIQSKYMKLQQLLIDVSEKQKFFTEIETQLSAGETNEGKKAS